MKRSKIDNFLKNEMEKDVENGKALEDFTANPFLVPFFNFFYYIAIVPFKTELSLENNRYKLKTHLIHQVVCALLHIGVLIFISVVTLDGFKMVTASSGIITIFDCAIHISSSISAILLVYTFWIRREQYLEVIESTRVIFTNTRKLRITHMLVQAGFILILIIFGILDWLMLSEKIGFGPLTFIIDEIDTHRLHINHHPFVSINNSLLNSTVDQIEDFFDSGTAKDTNGSDIIIIFWTSLYYLVALFMFQFYVICQLVFLMLAVSLREVGKQFSIEMFDFRFGKDGIKQGIQKYQKLKSITDLVRDVYGNALLAYYFSAVAYYAEVPHVFWGRRGETQKFIMVYFVVSGLIWLIAAEFHNNVKTTVLKWIDFHIDLDETSSDQRIRLHIISGEITSNDSSTVSLGSKCFPVTYSHLGSMLGLVVTYGIIVFQLHHNEEKQSN